MPKPRTERVFFTRGQLARRWGVSVDRVCQLIEAGQLEGVFEIPSVEGFGKVVKIPLESVKAAERSWSVGTPGDLGETEQESAGGVADGPAGETLRARTSPGEVPGSIP